MPTDSRWDLIQGLTG